MRIFIEARVCTALSIKYGGDPGAEFKIKKSDLIEAWREWTRFPVNKLDEKIHVLADELILIQTSFAGYFDTKIVSNNLHV